MSNWPESPRRQLRRRKPRSVSLDELGPHGHLHAMTTARIIRTDSTNPDIRGLVALLDQELSVRDGEEHGFYAAFNKIDSLAHVVVAYQGGLPVGCGAIKEHSDRVAEIKRMFVLPEHRGQGIAGRVLLELEKWAQELGFAECILLKPARAARGDPLVSEEWLHSDSELWAVPGCRE